MRTICRDEDIIHRLLPDHIDDKIVKLKLRCDNQIQCHSQVAHTYGYILVRVVNRQRRNKHKGMYTSGCRHSKYMHWWRSTTGNVDADCCQYVTKIVPLTNMQILWVDKGLPLYGYIKKQAYLSALRNVWSSIIIQNCSRANNQVFVVILLRSDCKMQSIHNVEELKEDRASTFVWAVSSESQHLHQLSSD